MWQLILGPILGIAGSVIEKVAEYKEAKLKAEERAKDRAHDLLVMDKEAELAIKKSTIEGQIRQDAAEQKTFSDSYKFNNDKLLPEDANLTPKQLNWIVAIEVLSKAIRPLTTVWYQLLIAVIFGWSAWQLVDAGSEAFSEKEIAGIFKEIIYSIIAMGETTLLWYYGIRRMSKKKAA